MTARRTRLRLSALALAVVVLASGCQYRYGVVGDSVTYDALDELEDRGAYVRAFGGVDIPTGRPAIQQLRQDGFRVIVSALGGTDLGRGVALSTIRRRIRNAMGDMAGVRCKVWLTLNENPNLHAGWPDKAHAVNVALRRIAANHGVLVAPWHRVAAQHRGAWFRRDGIHLRATGQLGYAAFISRYVRGHC